VRVTSRGGRAVEAVGACSTTERRFAHAEHDTYAMAHTRAKSRAIADMLGAADQVAEEEGLLEEPAPKAPTPTPPPTASPRTMAPPRADAGQQAVVWGFLEQTLGEDLAELVSLEEKDGALLVKLDKMLVEKHGNAFLSRMMKWGYGVHESASGLVAMLAKPKPPNL